MEPSPLSLSSSRPPPLPLPPPPPPSSSSLPDQSLAPLLTLDEVIKDSHMHSVFLQYLSNNDKKGFARLLFLVSVEEFKTLIATLEKSSNSFEEDVSNANRRVVYASKIISKFMCKDSFLDIASDNLHILNKSVWSFGSFLKNDLMMCSGLSSRADLFAEAESAVKTALEQSFEKFTKTTAFGELLKSSECFPESLMTPTVHDVNGNPSAGAEPPTTTPGASSPSKTGGSGVVPVALPAPASSPSKVLKLQTVLSNRRLCSVFWVFLFKERTHQSLSLWMDFHYQLIPLLRGLRQASLEEEQENQLKKAGEGEAEEVKDDDERLEAQEDRVMEDESERMRPIDFLDQVHAVSLKIINKYLKPGANVQVHFVGENDRVLAETFEQEMKHLGRTHEASVGNVDSCFKTIELLVGSLEYDLQVNHFVRFMKSDNFKMLVNSYQSRLFSPCSTTEWLNVASPLVLDRREKHFGPSISSVSLHSAAVTAMAGVGGGDDASSDCSMTTLQELFHCMNVVSHQPQRIRGRRFSFEELFMQKVRQEKQVKRRKSLSMDPSGVCSEQEEFSLISSVIRFRVEKNSASGENGSSRNLLSNANENAEIVKKVLYSLADSDGDEDLRHHHAIPEHVESFFLPAGPKTVLSKTPPEPKLFHLTIGNAEKSFYCAVLTRYIVDKDESNLGPLEEVLREQEGIRGYIPAGICIISRYPLLNTLKSRLEKLHFQMEHDESYQHDADWEPSETQLEDLVHGGCIGFGANGGMICGVDLACASGDPIGGINSGPNEWIDFSMEELFNCLSIENVVTLISCVMLERQIVMVSSRYSVLTSVGETVKKLLSPLVWSHVFAPILPASMLECLQCPTPFLFGIHSSYRDELMEMLATGDCGSCSHAPPTPNGHSSGGMNHFAEVLVVDLDCNKLSYPVGVQLPTAIRTRLMNDLQRLLKPRIFFSDKVTSYRRRSAPELPTMSLISDPKNSSMPNIHFPLSPGVDSPTSDGPYSPISSQRFPVARVRQVFYRAMSQLLDQLEPFRFVISDDFDYVVVFDNDSFLGQVAKEDLGFYRNFLETQLFSHEIATVR